MQVFALLLTLVSSFVSSVAAEGLFVTFDVPETITNGDSTPIKLSISGGDIGDGQVTSVRTVLYRPGKRAPKFFTNLTHSPVAASEFVEIAPSYNLPTQQYKVGYSVLVQYDDGQEWIDSELVDVKVVDPSANIIRLLASLIIIVGTLISVSFLAFNMSTPGYWESRLPAWTHKYIPYTETNAKKRN